MILYHGTNVDFDVTEIKKTKKYKDFGQGFYLTDLKSQAEELAAKRALIFGGFPIVQKYEFDERLLAASDIKFLKFDSVCAEWAEFIYKISTSSEPTKLSTYSKDCKYDKRTNKQILG